MSWDYNFQSSSSYSQPQPVLPLTKPQLVQSVDNHQAMSSKSFDSSSSAATSAFVEHQLLPQNLWGEPAKKNNTLEEHLFLQNQLQQSEWTTAPSESAATEPSSLFDMRSNHTAATTPLSSNTPSIKLHPQAPSIGSSSSSAFTPLAPLLHNSNDNNNIMSSDSHMQPGTLASNINSLNSMNAAAQMAANTQSLLQNYQQQQQYLETVQQQQQQWLQNPLFLQQQAQLVSQQLQQLQLQLQQHQQQIESANQLLLAKTQEPLTLENLSKLDSPSTSTLSPTTTHVQHLEQSATGTTTQRKSSGSSSSDEKVNTELYKTELCSTFQRTGTCPYGNKCQFAHGEHELKHIDRGSKWRSKPCANWAKNGTCRYGNRCCFRHG